MDTNLEARWRAAMAANDSDALVEVGCELADADQEEHALSCFQRAVNLGQEWVWFNVGNSLKVLDRLEEAVDSYERALAAGETDAWLNLGFVLEALGDLAGAMRAFRAAAELGGQIAEGYGALAGLLHEQGEHTAAEDAIARAAETGNPYAIALQACWRWGRTRDPALEDALRAGAQIDGSARADLAKLLIMTGRRLEAREQLELGAKLGQYECWLPLGNLLCGDDLADDLTDDEAAALVDDDAAVDAYRAGITAGDNFCHHNLAMLLFELGDERGAEEHLMAGAAAGDELAQRAWQEMLRNGE